MFRPWVSLVCLTYWLKHILGSSISLYGLKIGICQNAQRSYDSGISHGVFYRMKNFKKFCQVLFRFQRIVTVKIIFIHLYSCLEHTLIRCLIRNTYCSPIITFYDNILFVKAYSSKIYIIFSEITLDLVNDRHVRLFR